MWNISLIIFQYAARSCVRTVVCARTSCPDAVRGQLWLKPPESWQATANRCWLLHMAASAAAALASRPGSIGHPEVMLPRTCRPDLKEEGDQQRTLLGGGQLRLMSPRVTIAFGYNMVVCSDLCCPGSGRPGIKMEVVAHSCNMVSGAANADCSFSYPTRGQPRLVSPETESWLCHR